MQGKRPKFVVGNWKMYGCLAENEILLRAITNGIDELSDDLNIGVCAPFPYLAQMQTLLRGSRMAYGVQDISAYRQGAYTGEVAAEMAAEFGATLAIVGHSERRTYHRESAQSTAAKASSALQAGLTPIVCVGETLEERNHGQTEEIIGTQLDTALAALSVDEAAQILVAYEPIWAVGTGNSATPAQAQAVHAFLRTRLALKGEQVAAVPILYGGSVKPDNARSLFIEPDIDGGLIGGASLNSQDFLAICHACQAVCLEHPNAIKPQTCV